jgi:hypothetical protein
VAEAGPIELKGPNNMAKQQTVSKPAAVPTVSEAEATVARLQEQQERVVAERAKAEAETGKHAYSAHAQGDVAAVAELDKIADIIMRHDQKLREINIALSEAGRVLQDARHAEARQAERERAGAQRAAFERMKLAGQMLDDALAVLVEAGDEIHAAVDTLHVAGWDHPTGQQVLSFGERAIRTAVMQTMWSRCVERLGPNERVSFSHVVSQWQQVFERRLGELQKEEAA